MLCAAPAHTVHYERRRPQQTILHGLVREHLATFLSQVELGGGASLPRFVKDEFEAFLECGILAHGWRACSSVFFTSTSNTARSVAAT